ncbi:hypothetical protein ACJJTC_006249 [Scirpophaga incertulas]
MESAVQYLLLALALASVQISYTESRLNEKRRDKTERRFYSNQIKDNICDIADRDSKVHCYCENTEEKTATRADCWVFNGGIDKSDPLWASFNTQPFLERLTFNVRSNGALKFIPLQVIKRLKRLQKLYIHYADLGKIEKKTFSNMSAVREIILMHDNITELDFSSFTNLPSLVNLTIKENKVTEIQRDVFVDLSSLRYLDLSFNSINLAHDGCFEHLTILNDLILEANSITILTRDTFRGLANLTRLDLRSNKLSMIGDLTFTELWNLNELLLDNNKLKYLSERAFDGLVLLQKLSMTGNKLKSINEGLLEGVRGLELLDLRNNEIEHFTYENVKPIIDNLKMKTSVLYLSGNKLMCDCHISWIKVLRNETTSDILQAALDDITCIPNYSEDYETNSVTEYDASPKTVSEVVTSTMVHQINNDEQLEGTNQALKTDPTVEPFIKEQLPIVNMPSGALLCSREMVQNKEDSLMLKSIGKVLWGGNASSKLRVYSSLVLKLLFLLAILK